MRLFLTLMTGNGKLEMLEELISPVIHYFDGIIAVFHKDDGENADEGYNFLVENKKVGEIITIPYTGRHEFSRNHCVFSKKFQYGDWFIQIDDLERLDLEFCKKLKDLINVANQQGVLGFYLHSKPFLFKWSERIMYVGTPHESLRSIDALENDKFVELAGLNNGEFNEARINVRPKYRTDPLHFVGHFAKYYLNQPPGSNTCLLGLEQNITNFDQVSLRELFENRERTRLEFREFMRSVTGGFVDIQSLTFFLKNASQHELYKPILSKYLNKEKILNDYYRLYVLGEKDIIDSHKFSDIKPIKL